MNGKYYVAKWNGTNWSELASASDSLKANNGIISLSTDGSGNVYTAGVFTNPSGKYYIAKWNGTNWSELASATDSLKANNIIISLCTDGSGNVYTAGVFTNPSGKHYVAKWNGTNWSELGGLNGLAANQNIRSIVTDFSGNVYAAGEFKDLNNYFYVAKYGICTSSSYTTINRSLCGGGSIIVNGKTYNKTGVYYDTTFNYQFCDSFITTHLFVGLDTAKICLVTVDSNSTHNVVVWEKNIVTKESVDSFRVYRETSTNVYSYLASIPKDSLSEYHDYAANPNTTSYKYKLTAVDTCGHLLPLSHYHNTIQLQNLGNGNFQWTLYQIENEANPVNYYVILRDNNSTGNFQSISSTIPGSNSTYTDVNFSSYPNASYRVAVNWSISCSPSKSTSTSYSNILKFGNSGISSICNNSIKISPNPTNTFTTITFTKPVNNTTIKLINLTGQTIIEKQNLTGDHFKFDISQQANGIYFLEIINNGYISRIKIIKE